MAPRTDTAHKPGVLAPTGVLAPAPIEVESPAFKGSLAMLFGCVREGKVDLREVPLNPICAAYVTYLAQCERIDLDQAAAGLSALCYLLERKAWLLLPTAEPEPMEDEPFELPEPSVYEFDEAIRVLRSGWEARTLRFFRPAERGNGHYEVPFEIGDVAIGDLAAVFARVMERACPEPVDVPERPMRSLSDQMRLMLQNLDGKWCPFEEILVTPFSRRDVVWSFLALLELIRLGQVRLKLQGETVLFASRSAAERSSKAPERAAARAL